MISAIRRSVMSLYEPVLADADASARVGLVTHELLENVLRHSSNGDMVLNIHIDPTCSLVSVETKNSASPEKIAELRERAETMAHGDPDTIYQEAFTESVLNDRVGGLGLARIRAEGLMTLDVRTEGDFVCVIASTKYGVAA